MFRIYVLRDPSIHYWRAAICCRGFWFLMKPAIIKKIIGDLLDNEMNHIKESSSAQSGDRHAAVSEGVGKVEALCEHDRELMIEFSRICVRRLGRHLSLKFFLSLFGHVLDANVHKEIEKDSLIIKHAAAWFDMGKNRTDMDVDGLFGKTREIDDEFIKKLATSLFSIEVRYDDFAEIRKKRILLFANLVFDLLLNWQDTLSFSDNMKNTYPENKYREVLGELLHLYNVETRMLSNSFTFHGPAGKIKDLFAEKLFATMEKTAAEVVAQYTRRLYGAGGPLFVR